MKKADVIAGLVLTGLLAVVSIFASKFPDGMEKVSYDKGFKEREWPPVISVIPDYVWPGEMNEKLAVFFAGIAGILIVFCSSCVIGHYLKK